MNSLDAPKIVFPCDYPVKVMGVANQEFRDHVMAVMERHAVFDKTAVIIRDSRNGRYQALNFIITATGEEQLKEIFTDLKASSLVQVVL